MDTNPADRPVVILVDPHEDSREMYAQYLSSCGFEVAATDNGAEALTKVRDARVIVTGLHLRGSIDGVELVRRVRLQDSEKPVIVLTAYADNAHRRAARQAGCDVYLSKPCEPAVLLAQIVRVLARSDAFGGG